MCGRFETTHLTWRQIHDQLSRFAQVTTPPLNLEPNDDVRPTTRQITARLENGAWTIEPMRWGLVPFWRSGKPIKDSEKGKGDGFKLTTFNARCESVATAATFREAFKRRRCVVPASAWYEWTGEKGVKVKHRFALADGEPLWFAGIWDRCTTSDEGDLASFTILTGPSSGWLTEYHSRAPVVLDGHEIGAWVDLNRDPADLVDAVRPDRFALT